MRKSTSLRKKVINTPKSNISIDTSTKNLDRLAQDHLLQISNDLHTDTNFLEAQLYFTIPTDHTSKSQIQDRNETDQQKKLVKRYLQHISKKKWPHKKNTFDNSSITTRQLPTKQYATIRNKIQLGESRRTSISMIQSIIPKYLLKRPTLIKQKPSIILQTSKEYNDQKKESECQLLLNTKIMDKKFYSVKSSRNSSPKRLPDKQISSNNTNNSIFMDKQFTRILLQNNCKQNSVVLSRLKRMHLQSASTNPHKLTILNLQLKEFPTPSSPTKKLRHI